MSTGYGLLAPRRLWVSCEHLLICVSACVIFFPARPQVRRNETRRTLLVWCSHRYRRWLRAHALRPACIERPALPASRAIASEQARRRLLSPPGGRDRLRGLYVIIDPAACEDRDPLDIAKLALDGGARLLQLRDKTREKGLQLPLAESLLDLCRGIGVPFIVNDHVDLALAVGADGVHVGQKDLPVAVVRRLVGPEMIIGASTNNPDEARRAEADGADYVSVGRLFETASKDDSRPASTDTIRAVKATVSLPLCAIGGIKESNIDQVIAAGADMVAAIRAVCAAPDPRKPARRLAERFT
jgi:thiamine-phosphate pyrophosphorylase